MGAEGPSGHLTQQYIGDSGTLSGDHLPLGNRIFTLSAFFVSIPGQPTDVGCELFIRSFGSISERTMVSEIGYSISSSSCAFLCSEYKLHSCNCMQRLASMKGVMSDDIFSIT